MKKYFYFLFVKYLTDTDEYVNILTNRVRLQVKQMGAIGRLGRYLEVIDKLPEEQGTISSHELARLVQVTPSTVRQDFFTYLDNKGKSRVGYDVRQLRGTLMTLLGLANSTKIVILGRGKLGRALVGYKEFQKINITFTAYFDNDKRKIGKTQDGIPVYHISELKSYLAKHLDVRMAILAVPAEVAQDVATYAEKCGIEAIWNFSPVLLNVREEVVVHNEYIGESLYNLIYELNQRKGSRKGELKMELMICVGSSCHLRGSEEVVKCFQSLIEKEKVGKEVTLKGSFCMGQCSETGVTVQFGNKFYKTKPGNAETFFYETLMPLIKGA